MKKILWAAFGLLLPLSLTAQTSEGIKKKPVEKVKHIQNDSVTNVAGERIVTRLSWNQPVVGGITKEQGTDALVNSIASSSKPRKSRKLQNGSSTQSAQASKDGQDKKKEITPAKNSKVSKSQGNKKVK